MGVFTVHGEMRVMGLNDFTITQKLVHRYVTNQHKNTDKCGGGWN